MVYLTLNYFISKNTSMFPAPLGAQPPIPWTLQPPCVSPLTVCSLTEAPWSTSTRAMALLPSMQAVISAFLPISSVTPHGSVCGDPPATASRSSSSVSPSRSPDSTRVKTSLCVDVMSVGYNAFSVGCFHGYSITRQSDLHTVLLLTNVSLPTRSFKIKVAAK